MSRIEDPDGWNAALVEARSGVCRVWRRGFVNPSIYGIDPVHYMSEYNKYETNRI